MAGAFLSLQVIAANQLGCSDDALCTNCCLVGHGNWASCGSVGSCTLGHNKSFLAWLFPSRTGYLPALWSSYLGDMQHFPWRDTIPSDVTGVIFRGWEPSHHFQIQLSMPSSLESDHSYLPSLPSNYRLLAPLSQHHSSQVIMCWPGRQVKYFCISHIWFKDRYSASFSCSCDGSASSSFTMWDLCPFLLYRSDWWLGGVSSLIPLQCLSPGLE